MAQTHLKRTFHIGDTVHIIAMDDSTGKDPVARVYSGREGIIQHIDSIGQLHGTWGGLALIPGIDEFRIIKHAE